MHGGNILFCLFSDVRMSRPAAKILQEFYLKLRDRATSADGTPITARQLESLVRLAQARARVDLREEITVEYVKVSLFSIMQPGYYQFKRYTDFFFFVFGTVFIRSRNVLVEH